MISIDNSTVISQFIETLLPFARCLALAQAKRTSVNRDDLISEAYVAVVEYASNPDTDISLTQCINRRLNQFCNRERQAMFPSLDVGTADSYEDSVIKREEIRQLYEALGTLTETERYTVVESIIYGMTYQDIATTLGISTASVFRIRTNAIAKIRKHLEVL